MRPQDRTVARELARIADGQHGLATRSQLLIAGVTSDQLKRRVRRGELIVVHRGVYRVGHRAPNLEATYLAAVLACGIGALLSGRAAAYLYSLLRGKPPVPEVTCRTERRIQGVITHRARRGDAQDAAEYRRIPVTNVARTLVDLAAVLSQGDLARACHEAGVRYRTTPAHLESVLARRPTAAGAAALRRVIHGDVHITLSKLESRFLDILEANGLPAPETNRPAGGRRVDCRWPAHNLTVELDSYTYHRSRHAWEQDRRREREAHAREDDFRRYTYGDVFEHPRLMLRELRRILRIRQVS